MSINHSSNTPADDRDYNPMMDLLEQSEAQRTYQRGDVVMGTVAMVGEHEILIDVGAKQEGVLAPREFDSMTSSERRSLRVGDEVEVLVVNPHDREGNLVLSLSQARLGQDWDDGEKLFEEGVIQAFTIKTSSKNVKALVEVKIDVNVNTSEIADQIASFEGVSEVYEVTGEEGEAAPRKVERKRAARDDAVGTTADSGI